jgi:hypothetical protein
MRNRSVLGGMTFAAAIAAAAVVTHSFGDADAGALGLFKAN